ncbi:pilus assembly protein PilP [Halomonas sp. V046]|uniref:pilus assembly protein PilP n=1 Tax=Halomonas sp. V046 TaxID=3459611 RepID=UPI004044A40F
MQGMVILVLLLAGCVDPELDALDRTLARLRDHPQAVPVPVLAELPVLSVPDYRYGGSRSPFRRAGVASVSGQERAGNGLAAYPLDALTLVGVLGRDGQRWAVVRDPEGRVHRVGVGTPLGLAGRRVVAIDNQGMRLAAASVGALGGALNGSDGDSKGDDEGDVESDVEGRLALGDSGKRYLLKALGQ